jgi:hypothetical protein
MIRKKKNFFDGFLYCKCKVFVSPASNQFNLVSSGLSRELNILLLSKRFNIGSLEEAFHQFYSLDKYVKTNFVLQKGHSKACLLCTEVDLF